jgi:putative PIN family toxin of toxin-antitoxin system
MLSCGWTLILSPFILEELDRALRYPRLQRRSGLTEALIADFLAELAAVAEVADIDGRHPVPIGDPNDAHIVLAALVGKADYLCTLDRDFYTAEIVDFCASRGTSIVSDVNLLQIVRSAKR